MSKCSLYNKFSVCALVLLLLESSLNHLSVGTCFPPNVPLYLKSCVHRHGALVTGHLLYSRITWVTNSPEACECISWSVEAYKGITKRRRGGIIPHFSVSFKRRLGWHPGTLVLGSRDCRLPPRKPQNSLEAMASSCRVC